MSLLEEKQIAMLPEAEAAQNRVKNKGILEQDKPVASMRMSLYAQLKQAYIIAITASEESQAPGVASHSTSQATSPCARH